MHLYKSIRTLIVLAVCLFGANTVQAASYAYDGVTTLCTSTCDSFAALTAPPTPSTLVGGVQIDVGASDTFAFADVGGFAFLVTSPTAPLEPWNGSNAPTANPLPVTPDVAEVVAANMAGTFTTGGTTDAAGEITEGTILFRFTVPPFDSNGAWVLFDAGTGEAKVCLFFDVSGCIPGATESVIIAGSFGLGTDSDGDHFVDSVDNCTDVANADQLDTNGDGHGNICDTDLNNDCITNPLDLGLFKLVFFTGDDDADFNGDNVVNPLDLGIFKLNFFTPPGPSAAGDCTPT